MDWILEYTKSMYWILDYTKSMYWVLVVLSMAKSFNAPFFTARKLNLTVLLEELEVVIKSHPLWGTLYNVC